MVKRLYVKGTRYGTKGKEVNAQDIKGVKGYEARGKRHNTKAYLRV